MGGDSLINMNRSGQAFINRLPAANNHLNYVATTTTSLATISDHNALEEVPSFNESNAKLPLQNDENVSAERQRSQFNQRSCEQLICNCCFCDDICPNRAILFSANNGEYSDNQESAFDGPYCDLQIETSVTQSTDNDPFLPTHLGDLSDPFTQHQANPLDDSYTYTDVYLSSSCRTRKPFSSLTSCNSSSTLASFNDESLLESLPHRNLPNEYDKKDLQDSNLSQQFTFSCLPSISQSMEIVRRVSELEDDPYPVINQQFDSVSGNKDAEESTSGSVLERDFAGPLNKSSVMNCYTEFEFVEDLDSKNGHENELSLFDHPLKSKRKDQNRVKER